uniref:Uncharacterized protein n=1 Tax=Populus davidiana TaxID=266767 RepID=A0A6M2F8L0_9ROSI
MFLKRRRKVGNRDMEATIPCNLLIMACSCALLTLSLDGNPVPSHSSGLLFSHSITSLFRQVSSFSSTFRFFICSFIINNGSINHSNTFSRGPLFLANSTSSEITSPDESDFADTSRQCSTDQVGSLMLSFLQLPFRRHSSISWILTRPSRRSILPFTSQALNNQSHTCTALYCWISHFSVLDFCEMSCALSEFSLLVFKLLSSPGLGFAFLRYLGLAGHGDVSESIRFSGIRSPAPFFDINYTE